MKNHYIEWLDELQQTQRIEIVDRINGYQNDGSFADADTPKS